MHFKRRIRQNRSRHIEIWKRESCRMVSAFYDHGRGRYPFEQKISTVSHFSMYCSSIEISSKSSTVMCQQQSLVRMGMVRFAFYDWSLGKEVQGVKDNRLFGMCAPSSQTRKSGIISRSRCLTILTWSSARVSNPTNRAMSGETKVRGKDQESSWTCVSSVTAVLCSLLTSSAPDVGKELPRQDAIVQVIG